MRFSLFGWIVVIERKKKLTEKATLAKQEKARRMVYEAVKQLESEGKKVTAYAVAKVAGVSYHTAVKYLSANRPLCNSGERGE